MVVVVVLVLFVGLSGLSKPAWIVHSGSFSEQMEEDKVLTRTPSVRTRHNTGSFLLLFFLFHLMDETFHGTDSQHSSSRSLMHVCQQCLSVNVCLSARHRASHASCIT